MRLKNFKKNGTESSLMRALKILKGSKVMSLSLLEGQPIATNSQPISRARLKKSITVGSLKKPTMKRRFIATKQTNTSLRDIRKALKSKSSLKS